MTPLSTLTKMSPRARLALQGAGIETLEAAAAMSDAELLALRGVAEASVQRIRSWAAGEPEAESFSVGGDASKERRDRIWDLYRGLVAEGSPAQAAWEKAVAGVDLFYQQAEALP